MSTSEAKPKKVASLSNEKYTYKAISQALRAATCAVQKQAREAYQLFKQNPYHPGLHFKRIDPKEPIYSVRVTLGYRAVGRYEGDTIIWFWIGSHADYDRL